MGSKVIKLCGTSKSITASFNTSKEGDKLKNESGVFTKRELPWTFKIVIEDFSYFFESPSIPNTTFNNEDINNLLKDNLDSILSGI